MDSPHNYIENIIADIKSDYPYKNQISLIFDTLIGCYSARDKNRFICTNYTCDNNDIDGYKEMKIPRNDSIGQEIMKITCDYLRNEYKISEDKSGILSKEIVKMIQKGMII